MSEWFVVVIGIMNVILFVLAWAYCRSLDDLMKSINDYHRMLIEDCDKEAE